MKRRGSRRLVTSGFAALAIGLVVTVAGLLPPSAGATETQNATLHAPHVGATNPGFEEGECPTPPGDATWGWHFVLPGNDTTFVSISATFASAGVVTDFISVPTGKHAYVFTPGPDTLLSATAVVEGPETTFVLSHVCGGGESTTTTTTEESTTTTTEEESTTTTTEEESTTTTTEEESTTTTTEEESTTTTTDESTTTSSNEVQPTSTERTTTSNGPTSAPEQQQQQAAAPVDVLGSTQSPTLPRTGSSTTVLLVLGLSLVSGGLMLLVAARRPRAS